jgi:SET domain-containing protein
MAEPTAFVREVVLPGNSTEVPVLDERCCYFRLRADCSPIHRFGIFAAEPIPARRRVIEYTGQKIGIREAWRRSIRTHLYLFWLTDRCAVDGAIGGSGAEFINHSCDPNLAARRAGGRIYLVSLRPISAGEELTLDYHLDPAEPAIACTCGAANCRRWINR